MTARISLIPGTTRGLRPRLQMLLHEFCNSLQRGGVDATSRKMPRSHIWWSGRCGQAWGNTSACRPTAPSAALRRLRDILLTAQPPVLIRRLSK